MLRDDAVKAGLIKPTPEEIEKFNLKKKFKKSKKEINIKKGKVEDKAPDSDFFI